MNAEVIEMAPHKLQLAGAVADGDQYTDSTAILLNVEDVIVADRYRKELGDVSDLADSIVQVGLLNPITVREWHGGFRLVAGERRLTAFKKLGLAEIPARVARDIADARDALVAERDENTARKEMLPSEKAALGMAIEEFEKPAAAARQGARNDLVGTSCSREHEVEGSRSRDVAAEAVDLSPATYTRLKTLVNLSTDEAQPADVQDAAREALDDIDQGAPIRRGYDRVKEVRRKSESVTVESAPTSGRAVDIEAREWHQRLAEKYPTAKHAFDAEGHERHANLEAFKQAAVSRYGVSYRFTEPSYKKHANTSQDRLYRASLQLEAAIGVFEHIDLETITKEQATDALQRVDTRQFNLIIRSLKEISNG